MFNFQTILQLSLICYFGLAPPYPHCPIQKYPPSQYASLDLTIISCVWCSDIVFVCTHSRPDNPLFHYQIRPDTLFMFPDSNHLLHLARKQTVQPHTEESTTVMVAEEENQKKPSRVSSCQAQAKPKPIITRPNPTNLEQIIYIIYFLLTKKYLMRYYY